MSAWFKMEASMKLKTAKEKRVEIVDDIEIVHDSSIKYEEAELAILKVDTISTFDIYIKRDNEYYLVLYQNQKITQSFIENLKQSRYEDIYTPMEQSKNLIEYMEKSLNDNKEFLREKKSAIIYTTATSIVDDLFKKEITVESLNKTKEVVHQILDNILKNDVTIESLIKVTSYDYYTYTHSVDVSVYSLGIGKELGLREYDLRSLGEAAILHDIGKSRIDPNIVNKNGKLTKEEFEIMKKHTTYGYEILKEKGIKNASILIGARSHHEKLNGDGYPSGLSQKRVPLFARIIAIADIFNALTTKRSYKEALSTFEAIKIMRNNMKDELDQHILKVFILMMSNH